MAAVNCSESKHEVMFWFFRMLEMQKTFLLTMDWRERGKPGCCIILLLFKCLNWCANHYSIASDVMYQQL